MSNSHTPGPWDWFAEVDPAGDELIGVKPGNKSDVADCSINGFRPFAERAANARLMAAAPTLLGALMDLVEAIGPQADSDPDCAVCAAWTNARAAIAKAGGNQLAKEQTP